MPTAGLYSPRTFSRRAAASRPLPGASLCTSFTVLVPHIMTCRAEA